MITTTMTVSTKIIFEIFFLVFAFLVFISIVVPWLTDLIQRKFFNKKNKDKEMSAELSVDEMIVATINSSKGLDERVRNQMIAWIKCAADFGSNIDELAEQNRLLKKENKYLRSVVDRARDDRNTVSTKPTV